MAEHLPGWIRRPEILAHIIDCYAGLDDDPERRGSRRRVFIWEVGDEIHMGNTEAFLEHLNDRFGLVLSPGSKSSIHGLLCELGERVKRPHSRDNTSTGRPSNPPEPEEWVIGHKTDEVGP